MRFQKISGSDPVVDYLAQTITERLAKDKRVVWLVPGGSAIKIASAVSRQLAVQDLSKLSVSLTDERFGPVGHKDSNWRQLEATGFRLPGARMFPVLTGKDMPQTVTDFGAMLQKLLTEADYALGLFGIGSDGHTAGILPESPAVRDPLYATGYDAGSFIRLTMTPKAISHLDETVVYAVGNEKLAVLESLRKEDISLDKQPAGIHKRILMSTMFNDQIGERV